MVKDTLGYVGMECKREKDILEEAKEDKKNGNSAKDQDRRSWERH